MSLSYSTVAVALALAAMMAGPAAAQQPNQENNARAKRFVEYYEATVRPLEIEAARLFWTANVTGKEADFKNKQEAEAKIDACLCDPQRFAELKAIKEGVVSDPLFARQIDVLYLGYLAKQVDRELLQKMLAKSNTVERAFNVFRPVVGGKQLSDNDLRRILRESHDSFERRAAWEAGKKVGPVVVGDLLELVALRNQAARKVGFTNYGVLRLHCGEQSQEQVLKLFDQLDDLTRAPFHEAKAEIDAALARSYGISVAELQPWHYHDPFFQEAPAVLGELPDALYKPLDIVKVCREFYDGIALPVDEVLKRSDLYEKPGKNPHAFSIDIDRRGDVRILENVVPGREWLTTTLHELGHAVYSENIGGGLPYLLHTEAHPLCTEGVAMMFQRLADDVDFLQAFGAEVSDPQQFRTAAAKLRRNRLLVFSRWCQVMFRFEMAMYDNPQQDLNRLWWDLVEKYQEIKRPEGRNEPDYASKYHFIGAPIYYHNYLMGEMFASQVQRAMGYWLVAGTKPVKIRYVGNKGVGEFMKQRVFAPGLTLNWNELTRHATGEELSAKAFVEDLKTAD